MISLQSKELIRHLNAGGFFARLYDVQLGKSKEGKVLQFVTNGEKPGGAPSNVRITALASDSLEVTWDDPEQRLRHGPINRYNIGYKEYG